MIDENYYCDNIDTRPNNPPRFQGQYYDEESDLHYNLNRYYDPFVGRYITQDPIKLIGSINFYQYYSDPINWIDPLGLFNFGKNGFEEIVGKDTRNYLQGKTLGEYSTIELDPLANDLANTFAGGRYKEIVLEQDIILYRAGTADKPFG